MDKLKPVTFDPRAHAAEKRKTSAEFRDAYDALEDEFAALAVFLQARKDAGMTQAEVAAKMGVSQPVLARIQSSLGSRKHAPSLETLREFVQRHRNRLVRLVGRHIPVQRQNCQQWYGVNPGTIRFRTEFSWNAPTGIDVIVSQSSGLVGSDKPVR
jgi:DNA-binding XRE family transcriptional regulator